MIRGLGAASVLAPFLPALESFGQSASIPKKLILIYSPHGTEYGNWRPSGGEMDFSLSRILAPLERHKNQLIIPDGLQLPATGITGAHSEGTPLLWTGSQLLPGDLFKHPDVGTSYGWNAGTSVDQFVAQSMAGQTPYSSLEFGVQAMSSAAPYTRTIYAGPEQPLHPWNDPQAMFERLYADFGKDDETLAKLRADRKSVIDVVKAQLDALRPRYSASDGKKIDQHLDAMRAIEERLEGTATTCEPPEGGAVNYENIDDMPRVSELQMKMLARALACNLTDVASVQYGIGDNTNISYPWLGISESHHGMSHLGTPESMEGLTNIYTWYAEQVALLLDELAAVQTIDGKTLLDHSLVVWGTEVAVGETHAFSPMPFVMAGGAGGALNTGRFMQYGGQSHCRLLVTICQAMGLSVDSYGDLDSGSGPLAGLLNV